MYTIKDNVYSDAGKILFMDNAIGFMLNAAYRECNERELDISDMSVSDTFIVFDIIRWLNPSIHTYADAKKYVVNKRYSNDDQIAIILNKDNSEEDALVFQKMQEWRDWASVVAHKIMDCINSSQNGEEEND